MSFQFVNWFPNWRGLRLHKWPDHWPYVWSINVAWFEIRRWRKAWPPESDTP